VPQHLREFAGHSPNADQVVERVLDATIVLPLGAEPGSYEVRLVDDVPSVRAQAVGNADIRDSMTTLHASLDAASWPAGAYHLEVRRAGDEWRRVPARLQ